MKAQMWSMDFVISVTMFFITIVLVLFAWNYVASENYEQTLFNEIENKGLVVSDILVRTAGSPPDWNETALAIGLASQENMIDEDRLRNFLYYMDYNESRRIMGIGNYHYYFSMKDIHNQVLQIDGNNIQKGLYPSVNVNTVVPTQRYVLFRGKLAKTDFILWV